MMVIVVIRSRNNSSIYSFSRASLVNLFTGLVTDAFFIEIFSHHTYNIIIIYTHVYDLLFTSVCYYYIPVAFLEYLYSVFENTGRGLYYTTLL